ncbi:MAG: hypothetical protein ACRD6X_11885 [Pyrinomonadaceae bacterium]
MKKILLKLTMVALLLSSSAVSSYACEASCSSDDPMESNESIFYLIFNLIGNAVNASADNTDNVPAYDTDRHVESVTALPN